MVRLYCCTKPSCCCTKILFNTNLYIKFCYNAEINRCREIYVRILCLYRFIYMNMQTYIYIYIHKYKTQYINTIVTEIRSIQEKALQSLSGLRIKLVSTPVSMHYIPGVELRVYNAYKKLRC